MTNLFYNPTGNPADLTRGLAGLVRDEYAMIGAGFDKLPSPSSLAGGRQNYAVDTGVANAYVIAVGSQVTAYVDGLTLLFKATNANTGASTLNVNGLGVKQLVRYEGSALQSGDISASQIVQVSYDATAGKFQLSSTAAAANAAAAAASAAAAAASAAAAAASASAASTSATNAATSASNSSTSAAAAAASAAAAAASAAAADATASAIDPDTAPAASTPYADTDRFGMKQSGTWKRGVMLTLATYVIQYAAVFLAGATAIARTISHKFRDTPSYRDYGAVIDGATDDTAAVNAAHAAVNSGQIKSLFFPAGHMKVNGALTTITMPGAAIYGTGRQTSIIKQASTSANTMSFQPTNPANYLYDIALRNFTIQVTGSNPTAGVALRLTRVINSVFDLDIRGCYQGALIEGGYGQAWEHPSILSTNTWGSVQSNTYLMKVTTDPYGNNDIPSEIRITQPNFKGAGLYGAGNEYLDYGLWVQTCDGLFIVGGHIGFAYTAGLWLNPQNNAALSLQNFESTGVYYDGQANGLATSAGVLVSGSTTPVCGRIKFIGGDAKNWDGAGFKFDLSSLIEPQVDGVLIAENGKQGISINGGTGYTINGNTFKNNNGSNTSANCIDIVGAVKGTLSNNLLLDGAFVHPVGGAFSTGPLDWTVTGNVVGQNVTKMFTATGSNRLKFSNNQKVGGVASIVSADGWVMPLGVREVILTGNTDWSNISNSESGLDGQMVTIRFTGTPTVFTGGVGNLILAGDFTATVGATLTLMCWSSTWYEVSRSTQSPAKVAVGGTGAATLTGLLQGNGTGAFTGIANSSTVGQVLRVTGAATYAWGALNLASSDAVTGILGSANGGTGNGFTKFSGPTTSEKTFTLPNASSTLLYEGGTIGATTANTGKFTTVETTSNISMGTAPVAQHSFRNSLSISGATTAFANLSNGTIQSGVTTEAVGYGTSLSTVAAAFTLANLRHFKVGQGTIGAGSTVTDQVGIYIDSSLTGATNNYALQAHIAAAANRWNIYVAGTADNAIAGATRFGSTTAPVNTVDITGSLGLGAPVTKTADFTVGAAETALINNKSGSTCVVTLPTASSFTGRILFFVNIQAQLVNSNASNVVPRAGGAAGTAILSATAGQWAILMSDGANWKIMAGS